MPERIDFSTDIDHDQGTLAWNDVLSAAPGAVKHILAGVRRAQGMDDALRTLSIHAWLRSHAYPGLVLKTAIDDEGYPVEDPAGVPLLAVEVMQEDMSTRPALITRYPEVVAISGVDAGQCNQGLQWLRAEGSVDLEGLAEAYPEQMQAWRAAIEQCEGAWLQSHRTQHMAVAMVERDNAAVACFEVMDLLLTLPGEDRAALLNSDRGPVHHALLARLQTEAGIEGTTRSEAGLGDLGTFDNEAAQGNLTLGCVVVCLPSDARKAELSRRQIAAATPGATAGGRGVRL